MHDSKFHRKYEKAREAFCRCRWQFFTNKNLELKEIFIFSRQCKDSLLHVNDSLQQNRD